MKAGKRPALECPDCGYAITQLAEAVEALEAGGNCPTCGASMDQDALEAAVDNWDDFLALREGAERAGDEAELLKEEEWIEAGPDFGDEGEEDEEE